MMKLMTLKQYMNMSKPALIRKITKTLRAMPKKRLALVCYNITKSKLPRLRKTNPRRITLKEAIEFKQKGFETAHQYNVLNPYIPKPKKKKEKLTKAEKKRRQKKLSAINKWRVSQGMKKIVIK